MGTGIDVTEHEQLTAALRKSELELRQILDLAPQLIAVLGPKRERLYANRPALTYVGCTLEEWQQRVMGEPGSEAHPEDAEQIMAVGERALYWVGLRAGVAAAQRRRQLPLVSGSFQPGSR